MKNNITVRPTRAEDFPAIFEILHQCGLVKPWFTRERFERMFARNPSTFFVAEDAKLIVGKLIVGTICATHDGAYIGYIYKVGVLPSHQRLGIGRALVQEVMDVFRADGIYRCFAWIQPENTGSIALFSKFGITLQTGGVYSRRLIE